MFRDMQKQCPRRFLGAMLFGLSCCAALIAAAGVRAAEPAAGRHQLILISIDGLRPDFYRDSSWPAPNLQALARRGVSADGVRGVFPTRKSGVRSCIPSFLTCDGSSEGLWGRFLIALKRSNARPRVRQFLRPSFHGALRDKAAQRRLALRSANKEEAV